MTRVIGAKGEVLQGVLRHLLLSVGIGIYIVPCIRRSVLINKLLSGILCDITSGSSKNPHEIRHQDLPGLGVFP